MRDPLQGGRPGDERAFIHKKIFKGLGAVAGFVGNLPIVRALPGAGLLQTAGTVLPRLFTTNGGRGADGSRLPESHPMTKNRSVGIAPQDFRMARAPGTDVACKPCRTNRSGYFVQSQPGNPAAGGTWIERDSVCTRPRRMNPGNAAAARRAVRRLKSFDRLSRNVEKELKKIARVRR